ncbi:hypothetical protein MMC07_006334 [Pseudocyphellaria aurata]|nr:hypothetical protein [Pseudocyphellaria aurata]
MSGQSDGPTPRSSPQSRSPAQSSSTGSTQPVVDNKEDLDASNTRIVHNNRDRFLKIDGTTVRDRSSTGAAGKGHGARRELDHRSQRARNSGGFLVQPPSAPIFRSDTPEFSIEPVSENSKGKRKIEHGDLAIPKRRPVRQLNETKSAVGSSPLSIEVLNAVPTRAGGSDGGSSREEILSRPSQSRNFNHGLKNGNANMESRPAMNRYEPPPGTPGGLGLDTDPAQIVNLALNLSESRRRTFSVGHSQPVNGLANRRLPSLNQHSLSSSGGITTVAGGGSLRQYLQQQRHASRNVSPRSSRRRDRDVSFPPSPRKADGHKQPYALDPTDEVILNASDATIARAERAKVALELQYEYRRLLNYLPPIPRPSKKTVPAKPTTKTRSETAQSLGRSYNPLQYIRNRTVRDGKGRKLDAEAAGWNNLDDVKNWIDIVAGEREVGMSTVDDQYPLPPFVSTETDPKSRAPSPELETAVPIGNLNSQPRRSKFTWSIAPWDLLADAYWLHQDDNIKYIEDPNGTKIFQMKDKNQETPTRTSRESARSSTRRSQSITRQFVYPEKSGSLVSTSRNGSRERGRHQYHPQHHREHNSLITNENDYRDRRRRWPRGLIRSRSSSSSNDSLEGRIADHPHSAALEKQMRELAKKEAETEMLTKFDNAKQYGDPKGTAQPSHIDKTRFPNGAYARFDIGRTKTLQELQHARSNSDRISYSARTSFDEKQAQQRRHSLIEQSTTDLDSSSARDFEPNSVISSSPPVSRPATPNLVLLSRSSSFYQDHEAKSIDRDSHLVQQKEVTDPAGRTTGDSKSHDLPYKERIANFGSGLLSPITAEAFGRKSKRADGISTRSTKEPNDPDSKFRGFFKGGRIAELVGNEVTRVGEMMWKKESSSDLSRVPSTIFNDPFEESDIEANMSGLDSSPENPLSRTTTSNDESARSSQNLTTGDGPKYHMSNLPSFRSPFSKDEQSPGTSKGHLHADHITRQQMAQRARGRSSRFELNAPPKIDIKQASPNSSPPVTLNRTRDTDTLYNDSRRSSVSRSDSRVLEADRRLNGILGSPGTASFGGPPVSLLTGLDSGQHRSGKGANPHGERRWSISDRGISAARGNVTKRDIARARALLLTSGIKANEITRRAQEIPAVPCAELQNLEKSLKRPLPRVPRSQEHILVARMLISTIDSSNRQLREAAEAFTHTTVENLHEQIRAIDEDVTYKLTSAVRAAADEADAFSIELTTTHTLAVKQLHDNIDIILRRRRRRFRWVRRLGYVMLEWMVLGLMWWMWLVFEIIRWIRFSFGRFVQVVRWLFWM